MHKRPVVIVGNWKMYKTIQEATQFIETLAPILKKSQEKVYLAVPFTALQAAAERVRRLEASLVIGAQNMNDATEGAFTGEIAGRMLKEAGAEFVILGHSERRTIFHESDAFINRKIKKALEADLQPLFCIGETEEERSSGEMKNILRKQVFEGLKDVSSKELKHLILAYEPIWAIGTGKVAKAEEAEEAHLFCRELIREGWGDVADSLSILYGGSVKPDNAAKLLKMPNIDGLLVGGASLSPQTFHQIILSHST